MATETGSTNGQRTSQQAGDGGQTARGGGSTSGQRNQPVASRERGQSVTSRQRGTPTPFSSFEQNPFASLWQISREMDRLMDAFFGGGLASGAAPAGRSIEPRYGGSAIWAPQVEVRQREDSMIIHVDLPGVKQEDIQLEATEDGLAISGERTEQREEGEQGFRRTERTYGSFYRMIPLPDGARLDNVKASMHNGVLEVTVPLERPQRRRIQIESEQSRS